MPKQYVTQGTTSINVYKHIFWTEEISSIAHSCPTLQPHGLQHSRLPCSSPVPKACTNSCPSSWWCHPTISSFVIPFSSCNESVPWIRWPKYWSFSFSIIPCNECLGLISFRIDWWISLQSKELSRVFSNTTVQKHQFFGDQLSFWSNSHIHTWTSGKTVALIRWTFVGKVMSLLFNMLSRLVIAFLSRKKHLLISWLQSPSAVILEPRKIKSATVSTVSSSICHEVMETDVVILVF